LFQEAWDSCRDDYEASIAAHFLARHQPTPHACLQWNARAAQHAEAVTDGRTREFKASLYLNLADAYLGVGDGAAAATSLDTARGHVPALPEGGYRAFVERGIVGLQHRCDAFQSSAQKL
jgi:hypothetical protein